MSDISLKLMKCQDGEMDFVAFMVCNTFYIVIK